MGSSFILGFSYGSLKMNFGFHSSKVILRYHSDSNGVSNNNWSLRSLTPVAATSPRGFWSFRFICRCRSFIATTELMTPKKFLISQRTFMRCQWDWEFWLCRIVHIAELWPSGVVTTVLVSSDKLIFSDSLVSQPLSDTQKYHLQCWKWRRSVNDKINCMFLRDLQGSCLMKK